MAVKIRLRRVGAKKQPYYRIVIADARAPRDGRFIEILGAYNPLTNPSTITIDGERALYWLRNGAQPTDVVKNMLEKKGIWNSFTTGAPLPVEEPVAAPVAAPVAEAVVAAPAAEEAPVEAAPAEEVAVVEETPTVAEVPAVEEEASTEETSETE